MRRAAWQEPPHPPAGLPQPRRREAGRSGLHAPSVHSPSPCRLPARTLRKAGPKPPSGDGSAGAGAARLPMKCIGTAAHPLSPRRQRAGVPTFLTRGREARVGDRRLRIGDFRSLAPRSFSAQLQVVLNGESCVLEDAHRQATASVATRAHGDGDRQVALRVLQGEMAS
jgi:hypothetical protein